MYKEIKVRVKGISPLMLHNVRLANPLDPIVKEIKRISGKKAKTDSDHELLAQLEWLGGLYTTEGGTFEVTKEAVTISGFGQPCIPGEMVEAALRNAARKHKLGKQFEAGLICDGNWPIAGNGSTGKTVAQLAQDENYRDIRRVAMMGRSIMRCRPIFHKWEVAFTLNYLPTLINAEQIIDTLMLAGQVACFGDYRPKYGRFEIA